MQAQKIVAVITHDDQGGAQEALCRLCRALIQRGHDVRLWYLYRRGDLADPGLPHRFVLNNDRISCNDYVKLPFHLIKMLSLERPTVVISFLPLANILSQTIGSLLRVPVRIASQRNPVQTYSWPMKILDWYLGTIGCYTNNILNSTDVEQSIRNYPWPYRYKARVIHNAIEPISFDDMPRDEARSLFDLTPSETALVSIGRLTKQKNQAFLVQILGALKGFRLLLAGGGPEHERLRTVARRMGVADRVTFLGSLDQAAIRQLLHAADIFAMPSLYEGQSNALLEALSAGKAIIANDIPSHRETLISAEAEAGIVLPITHPDRWISALQQLADNTSKRHELGKLARIRAQDFTFDRMCAAFEAAIESTQLRSKAQRQAVQAS